MRSGQPGVRGALRLPLDVGRSGRMAAKGQTHAKRARELELKDRRERKRAKKAQRAVGNAPEAASSGSTTGAEVVSEWVQ